MKFSSKERFFEQMNTLYEKKIPFFFIMDFWGHAPEIIPFSALTDENVFFSTAETANTTAAAPVNKPLEWQQFPIKKTAYTAQFDQAKKALKAGDTYLLNLTCTTPIKTNYTLKELFDEGEAKYKLYFKDIFTHFSPEPFVKIKNGKIYAYPMKGTIDGSVEDAKSHILADEKELREQFTIVDLIRNDLSMVARQVRVEDFRYVEKIKTPQKDLLAVSTKIGGILREDYKDKPGHIFSKLLPAGSICGAPKAKTVELIKNIEEHNRNYYTGIWGIAKGTEIDSCVIIRYVEKTADGFVFKSGGGITSLSNADREYQEMIDKIYVPVS